MKLKKSKFNKKWNNIVVVIFFISENEVRIFIEEERLKSRNFSEKWNNIVVVN